MDTPPVARQVARDLPLGDLPQVARRLLADHALRSDIIANPNLTDELVCELVVGTHGTLIASEASILADGIRSFGPDVAETFVSSITSVRALTTVVRSGVLDADALHELAGAGAHVKGSLAAALLQADVALDQLKDAALRTGQDTLLTWTERAALGHQGRPVDIDELAAIIGDAAAWLSKPIRGMGGQLRRVLQHGEHVLQAAVDSGHSIVGSVAAGMAQLTDAQAWTLSGLVADGDGWTLDTSVQPAEDRKFVLMGLVNNPVCPREVLDALAKQLRRHRKLDEAARSLSQRLICKPDPVDVPFDEVDDDDQLSWLVGRACKRDIDALVVLRNPHLTADSVREIGQATAVGFLHDTPLRADIVDVLRVAADRSGLDIPPLWEHEWQDDDTEHGQHRPRPVTPPTIPKDVDAALARLTVDSSNSWTPPWLAPVLADRLGDDGDAWTTWTSLCADLDDSTTHAELVELVVGLAA